MQNGEPRNDRELALAAAAACSAGALDLLEASRGEMSLAANLVSREAAENIADALRSVLAIELGAPSSASPGFVDMMAERAVRSGVLLAAVQEFLEDWAA